VYVKHKAKIRFYQLLIPMRPCLLLTLEAKDRNKKQSRDPLMCH
jgi:hypothetical protein